MNAKKISLLLLVVIFFSGCVVYSFYPLYTENDLFANDILTGRWIDSDSTVWTFEHPLKGVQDNRKIDSTSYELNVLDKDNQKSKFSIHIIKLADHYFVDFYLEDFLDSNNLTLESFHIVPVHTFAKLEVSANKLQLNWFDQEWLNDLIRENKIRIHHEDNEDYILLTAKPKELQKFVIKYVNSEEAFKDGMDAELTRIK